MGHGQREQFSFPTRVIRVALCATRSRAFRKEKDRASWGSAVTSHGRSGSMAHDNGISIGGTMQGDSSRSAAARRKSDSSQDALVGLSRAVWSANGDGGNCPPDKFPTFRQLDDLITTTAWGSEAREEFFQRWQSLEPDHNATIETGGSFSELAHLVWTEAVEREPKLKHPLAPLIAAWQSGPLEVQAVRDVTGSLRGDTIAPRLAMRDGGNTRIDRLYLNPAHFGGDGEGGQMVLPGSRTGRRPAAYPYCRLTCTIWESKQVRAEEGRGLLRFRPACW